MSQDKNLAKPEEALKNITRKKRPYEFFVLTVAKKRQLLKVMRETGNKKTAAASIGASVAQLDRALSKDFTLYQKLKIAEAEFLEVLEKEARRRAVDGVEKPVYYQGDVVGFTTEYSDTLLQTLLKANDKDKYGNKSQVDHTTNIKVGSNELRGKLATALGVELEHSPEPLEDEIVDGEWEDVD